MTTPLSNLVQHLHTMGHRPPVVFTLPLPPSVNHCYRQWRGRTILSRKYRKWIDDASLSFLRENGKPTTIQGKCMVVLIVQPGRGWHRRRDMDNLLKPVQDWLVRAGLLVGDHCGLVPGCASLFLDDAAPLGEARLTVCLIPLGDAGSKEKHRTSGRRSRKPS